MSQDSDRVYNSKVYELYNPNLYTDMDIFHDEMRVAHLNTLHGIACNLAAMWRNEHIGASEEEVSAARAECFRSIFIPFWDIAAGIKLPVEVWYYHSPTSRLEGSMLQPDVEEDMGCFIYAYNEVLEGLEL